MPGCLCLESTPSGEWGPRGFSSEARCGVQGRRRFSWELGRSGSPETHAPHELGTRDRTSSLPCGRNVVPSAVWRCVSSFVLRREAPGLSAGCDTPRCTLPRAAGQSHGACRGRVVLACQAPCTPSLTHGTARGAPAPRTLTVPTDRARALRPPVSQSPPTRRRPVGATGRFADRRPVHQPCGRRPPLPRLPCARPLRSHACCGHTPAAVTCLLWQRPWLKFKTSIRPLHPSSQEAPAEARNCRQQGAPLGHDGPSSDVS